MGGGGILRAVYAILLQLVAVVNRMLCFLHIRRRRKSSSSSILPLHADVKVLASVAEVQTSLPSNDVELESWDSWTSDDQVNNKTNILSSSSAAGRYGHRFGGRKQPEPDLEPEVDYFQEMSLEPSIRKTKKVLVRKKDPGTLTAGGLSSRLAMSSDIPIISTGSELGTLDDAEAFGGWADEASEDLSLQADSALREKRRVDRERRLVEHRQKRLDKVPASAGSAPPVSKGRMSAVKMS